MKQNILIGALVLVIANLFFLNYHFYMDRQKVSDIVVQPVETVSDSITASEVEAGLSALEARLNKKLAEKTQVVISNALPEQEAGGSGGDSSHVGVVKLPETLSQLDYRAGGRTAFGITHIFAVKGDQCPAGSNPANMPEHQRAREAGFTYCFYWWDYLVFNKKDTDKCPDGMKPVAKERGASMRADEFFCRLPNSGESAKQRADLEAKLKAEEATRPQPAPEPEKPAEEAETTP